VAATNAIIDCFVLYAKVHGLKLNISNEKIDRTQRKPRIPGRILLFLKHKNSETITNSTNAITNNKTGKYCKNKTY
jgi:hypothetical protein